MLGFADLHTHPASHIAFGADSNGNNGLFWGKPAEDNGLGLMVPANDLSSCTSAPLLGPTHNPGSFDIVQLVTDALILGQLQATVTSATQAYSDNTQGYSTFNSWPSALSVSHQQMDITSIRRAFDGGLRLMFASVTDDELLGKLWNQKFSPFGSGPPTHDSNADFMSALTQLTYIQALVVAEPLDGDRDHAG